MAMRSRFKAKKFIIPVLLADVLIHLFSDDVNERNFMVRGWCLFDTYSRQDTTAGYPLGYTTRNGPVPIKMASTLSPYAPTGPAPPTSARNSAYRWTEDQYRWAILALRAVSLIFSNMKVANTLLRSPLQLNITLRVTKRTSTPTARVTLYFPPCFWVKTAGRQAAGTRINMGVCLVTPIPW
jgi:hypothetical protein